MTNNQYIWLQGNLEKYQYNTDKAKKLYEEYKGITFADDVQPSDDVMAKLVDCYDRFVSMFNNNPFVYKNGLKEFDIETSEFDYYFVKNNDSFVPIGYYKEKHPVESVLLLSEKIEKQKNTTIDIKTRLVELFEKESQVIAKEYEKFKNAKKANYFRASISALATILMFWYCIVFMKITCRIY